MAKIAHQKLKKYVKQRILSKALKMLFVFLLAYGPAGIVGRVIKLLSSKWVVNLLLKRLT